MVSHDCVAFYLLSEEVSKSVKVVQSGQGADEILAGYDWYPPLANVAREQTTEAYAKVFFDRGHSDVLSILAPEYGIDVDASLEYVTAHQGAPGADSAVDAALRLDTQVMLVDDPVKRVDNMTMAWGWRRGCPSSTTTSSNWPPPARPSEAVVGRQGCAQGRVAGAAAVAGDRSDEGLLPGARHPPSARRGARHGARRPEHDAARSRGCNRADTVDALLRHRTRRGPRWDRMRCGSWRYSRCGCRAWKAEGMGQQVRALYGASLSPDATAFAHLVDDGGYPRACSAFCAAGGPARRGMSSFPSRARSLVSSTPLTASGWPVRWRLRGEPVPRFGL